MSQLDILSRIEWKLDTLMRLVRNLGATIEEEINVMSAALDQAIIELQTELENNTSVESSAVTLIQALATQLQAALNKNVDDSAKVAAIQAVVSTFKTNDAALAAAVVSNTQSPGATPAPAPAPTPADTPPVQ